LSGKTFFWRDKLARVVIFKISPNALYPSSIFFYKDFIDYTLYLNLIFLYFLN